MTKEEKQEWNDLYEYVKLEVLGYDNKIMPKSFVLRLKGLSQGKFMANKNTKANASYSYKEILLTFKLSKAKIEQYIMKNNGSFANESHRFNGIMIIIESEINNTVDILNRKKQAEEKVEALDSEVHLSEQAYYKRKSSLNINNNKFKELL